MLGYVVPFRNRIFSPPISRRLALSMKVACSLAGHFKPQMKHTRTRLSSIAFAQTPVVQDCLTYRNARDLQDYLTQGSASYTREIVVRGERG